MVLAWLVGGGSWLTQSALVRWPFPTIARGYRVVLVGECGLSARGAATSPWLVLYLLPDRSMGTMRYCDWLPSKCCHVLAL